MRGDLGAGVAKYVTEHLARRLAGCEGAMAGLRVGVEGRLDVEAVLLPPARRRHIEQLTGDRRRDEDMGGVDRLSLSSKTARRVPELDVLGDVGGR